MLLPQKVLSRKDEITAAFLALAEQHLDDLMNGRAERRFSASDFGKLLFVNSRHLTTTVKLTTGQSVCDIMEARITEEASRLLTETSLSVADVGLRFAYDDPANFIKFFKGMTGTTPLQFRKQVIMASSQKN
ncbi:helix-turn-helix domain-containing protein [Chitinophagaceae bacterium MMS25-I14]